MLMYSCEQCGKEFAQKSHYDSHKRRKTPCKKNMDNIKQVVYKAVEGTLKKLNNEKLNVEEEVNIYNKMNTPTLDDDYAILKKYYDNKLNKDSNLVETSNDEPTPIDCVEEMVSKIPENFWQRKDIKILDPCCGCGNFPLVIYFKLIKYHTKEYILTNMLYFNDINMNRIDALKAVFNYKLNIYNEDFLLLTTAHKFDLIVANPPYAKLLPNGKRASKNHNLIGIFINKSLEILSDNGYLLYITPDNWMSYSDRNTLILELTRLQIQYINIHTAKKYFKKIGSSFVWYLIEKTPSYKDIEIEGIWKKKLYNDVVRSKYLCSL